MTKARTRVQNVNVQDIADELLEVRLQVAELTTKNKLLSAALKEHPDFKKQDKFYIQSSVSVIVSNMEKAMTWAKENAPQLIDLDTTKAKKLFEMSLKIPEGFEAKLTDRLMQKDEI